MPPTTPLSRSTRLVLASSLLLSLLASATSASGATTRRVPQDYATIQSAITASVAGDTILVAPGVYTGSVTVDRPVTLLGAGYDANDPRNNPAILDGANEPTVIVPRNVSPAPSIKGLTIRNGYDGIRSQSPVIVEDNYLTGNGDALDFSTGAGGTISGNVFVGGRDDAIDINHPVMDFLVEDNEILNSGGDGIEMRLNDDALSRTVRIVFRGNKISGGAHDGLQIIDYFQDTDRLIVVERNLFENLTQAAIGLLDNADTGEDFRGASIREPIHVFHNTFVDNDHGISGGDSLIALNNIFQGHNVAVKNVDANSVASHNLFWNNTTDTVGSVVDQSTTLFADPLLLADRALGAGSPAIDAGTASFTWRGQVVMQQPATSYTGSAPDLGWRERESGQGPAPQITSFSPASGPAGTEVTISGSGFAGATAVRFGGTSATYTVRSDSRIKAAVPQAAPSGPIRVKTPAGASTSGTSFTVTGGGSTSSSVTVSGTAFKPASTTVDPGTRVRWKFESSSPRTVTDARGLGASGAPLFDSGPRSAGATFDVVFAAAGRYPYTSMLPSPSNMTGTVDVPVTATPSSGSTSSTFTVRWASSTMPGYRYMPEYRYRSAPASTWSSWSDIGAKQTEELGTTFVADRGAGKYQFRSKLRNAATGVTSQFSPPTSVLVT